MSEEKLTSMIVKTLRDEKGKPFAPVTTYEALINEEGQQLSEILDNKVDFDGLKAGDNISIVTKGGYLPMEIGTKLGGAECIFNIEAFKVKDLNNNPYSGIELEAEKDGSGMTGGTSVHIGYILKTDTSSIYFKRITNSSRYTWYNLYIKYNGIETHILENKIAYNGTGFDNELQVHVGCYSFPFDFGTITEIIAPNLAAGIILREPKTATISTTLNYEANSNKPLINSVELLGNKTHEDLGLQPAGDYALNDRVDEIESEVDAIAAIQKQAAQAISYNNYEEMLQDLASADQDKFLIGQSIFIKTDGVTDVWVFNKMSESKTYTYTTDAKVQEDLAKLSGLEVGYYVLAPLESEKVNLTNYVQFNNAASAYNSGVVKVDSSRSGLYMSSGTVYTKAATQQEISDKTEEHNVITPANLEYAVKSIVSKTSDIINDSDFTTKDYVDTNVLDKIEEYINSNQESLTGESGVYVGPEAPTNPFVNVWIDTDDEIGGYDYDSLDNKPVINGVVLEGEKTSQDLGLGFIKEFVMSSTLVPADFFEVYSYWRETGVLPLVRVASDRGWTLQAIETSVWSTYTSVYFTFMSFGNSNNESIQVHKKVVDLRIYDSGDISFATNSNFTSIKDNNTFIPVAYVSSTGQNFLATSNSNAYTPSGNYNPATKKYVDDKIKTVIDVAFSLEIVEELPTVGMNYSTIYLIKSSNEELNAYDEYIFMQSGEWEMIGTTAINMSNYYSKAEVDAKIDELRNMITLATSEDIQNIVSPGQGDEGIDEGVDM
jgi:hypothetical protein